MNGTLAVTGDPASDELLNTDPLALLLGMLLDQQVPMEWAFGAPAKLRERLGGTLDATEIAAMDPDDVSAAFGQKPTLHRYWGSMAKRAHALCQAIVDDYGGRTEAIWEGAASGDELLKRLQALPGFGPEKSRIFMALLAKRFGVTPTGWEQAAAPFSDKTKRSVADITGPEALEEVRAYKRAKKAAGAANPKTA